MTPKEKVLDYIQKQYFKSRGKWECGYKSDYYKWEDLYNALTPFLNSEDYEIVKITKKGN